jgi:hypothetical protein
MNHVLARTAAAIKLTAVDSIGAFHLSQHRTCAIDLTT